MRACAPAFGTIDDDLIALAPRMGFDHREIAADIGFGQAVSKQEIAAGNLGQQLALLRFAAALTKVHARVADRHDIGAGDST